MAIKYLDAKRVQGLSDEGKSTSVGEAGETEVFANTSASEASWKYVDGLTAGESITHMIFDIYDWDTAEGKFALYTNGTVDGTDNLPKDRIGNVVTATLTQVSDGYLDEYYTNVYVATSGSPVVPSNGIVWVGIMRDSGSFLAKNFAGSGGYKNSVYNSDVAYGDVFPSEITSYPTNHIGGNSYRFGVRTLASADTKPTDVPSGSLFETTDTYKIHWFDGTTWSGLPSTNVIGFGGTGIQTETWDGISWLLRGDLPLTKRELGGGGSTTDALAIDGYGSGGTSYHTDTCYKWNGTAWSSTGDDVYERRNIGNSGGKNGSGGWVSGGKITGSTTDKTTTFSGSSWSASGDLPVSRTTTVGGGEKTNALLAQALDAYTFNGSTWTTIASLDSANSNEGSKQGAGDGNADNFLACGGEGGGGSSGNATSYLNNLWNGTAWSQGSSLPDGSGSIAKAGFGDTQGAGNTSKFVFMQGSVGGSLGGISRTYVWDGSSWTRGADCNYQRTSGNCGMGDV